MILCRTESVHFFMLMNSAAKISIAALFTTLVTKCHDPYKGRMERTVEGNSVSARAWSIEAIHLPTFT